MNEFDPMYEAPTFSSRTKIGAGLIAAAALGMTASSAGDKKDKHTFAKALSVAVGAIGTGFVIFELMKAGRGR